MQKSTDVAGGAIYDALVAAAAVEHNLPLLTRDRRALDSYRAVGADVEWLTNDSGEPELRSDLVLISLEGPCAVGHAK